MAKSKRKVNKIDASLRFDLSIMPSETKDQWEERMERPIKCIMTFGGEAEDYIKELEVEFEGFKVGLTRGDMAIFSAPAKYIPKIAEKDYVVLISGPKTYYPK